MVWFFIPPLPKPFLYFYTDAVSLPHLYHFFRRIHFPYNHFTHGSFFSTTSSHGFIYPTTILHMDPFLLPHTILAVKWANSHLQQLERRTKSTLNQSSARGVHLHFNLILYLVSADQNLKKIGSKSIWMQIYRSLGTSILTPL